VTRVLYVEDNDDNVYLLKMRFELLDGFEVLVAENGQIGCDIATAELPDLILMDLDLPVVDGWEATRRLKANPATRAIPIIALTAHAMAGSREKALDAQAEFLGRRAAVAHGAATRTLTPGSAPVSTTSSTVSWSSRRCRVLPLMDCARSRAIVTVGFDAGMRRPGGSHTSSRSGGSSPCST
jgi:CheY-like chemotaxis protein